MRAHYPRPVLDWTAEYEGGWSDHPDDPGGATYRGVTQRRYDEHRRANGLPPRTVRQMTDAEYAGIYRTYWTAVRGDDLPAGVDSVGFDAAVNSGPARSAKWLQRAAELSGRDVDGRVGPVTLAAIGVTGAVPVITRACRYRMSFLEGLRHWRTFGRGWTARVAKVEARALALADTAAIPQASRDARRKKDRATGGAAASGGGAGGANLADFPPDVIVAIAVVLILAAAGFLWIRHKHQAREKALKEVL